MSERRPWKQEEELALITEIVEGGKVVETCRKHGVNPAMYYKWRPLKRHSEQMASNLMA